MGGKIKTTNQVKNYEPIQKFRAGIFPTLKIKKTLFMGSSSPHRSYCSQQRAIKIGKAINKTKKPVLYSSGPQDESDLAQDAIVKTRKILNTANKTYMKTISGSVFLSVEVGQLFLRKNEHAVMEIVTEIKDTAMIPKKIG